MKYSFLFLLILSFPAFAQQKFKVDTLVNNGNVSNRINVVILGDGFMTHELPDFVAAAKSFAESFNAYEPFKQYSRYLNFFSISTPSPASGISNPGTAPDAYQNHPVVHVNNFYGGTFGTSIHRLVRVSRPSLVYEVLASNFPEYDMIIIILNTPFYGGAGGAFATFTLDSRANLIGIHEIGHSFGKLSDEYWAGSNYARENINMTKETLPQLVRWKDWLNTANIGVFPHGTTDETAQWMKPAKANCLMETLSKPYCAVCREATVEQIFRLVNPIDSLYPDATSTVHISAASEFGLNLIEPDPNTLKVWWDLNGKNIAGTKTVAIRPKDLSRAVSTLTATVVDETPISRKDPTLRTRSVTWRITGGTFSRISILPEKDSLCRGENTILTVRDCPGSLLWETGQTTETITVNPSVNTSYIAQCSLSNGLVLRDTLSLTVIQPPEARASNTGPYFEKEVIKLQAEGGSSYEWSGPLGFRSEEQNPEIAGARSTHSGIYHVSVRGMTDCVSQASTEVKVEMVLSRENENVQAKIYPNPARDFVRVEVPFEGSTTALLYNPEGKVLKHQVFEKNTSIKVDGLAAGLYFIKLQNGLKEVISKITLL